MYDRPTRTRRPWAATILLALLAVVATPCVPGPGIPGSTPVAPVTMLAPVELPNAPAVHPTASGLRNVEVGATCADAGGSGSGEAYDPVLGILYLAWAGCGAVSVARSIDGGYSFTAPIGLGSGLSAVGSESSVAVAPNGTVYVGFIGDAGNGPSPYVVRSWDRGVTFTAPIAAAPPIAGGFLDRERLAVAPNGSLFVAYVASPSAAADTLDCDGTGACAWLAGVYNLLVARSDDGGSTFATPVPVNPDYPDGAAVAGDLTVAPNGTVVAVVETFGVQGTARTLTNGSLAATSSADGGTSWAAPVSVIPAEIPNGTRHPDAAIGVDATGTAVIGFTAPGGGGDTTYATLSANGSTWSTPIAVSTDASGATHGSVAVAAGNANGTVWIGWTVNNGSVGGWLAFAAPLDLAGPSAGSVLLAANATGASGAGVGTSMGLADLGAGAAAVGWTFDPTGIDGLAISAVVGISPVPDAPRITTAITGAGSVTIGWLPPTGVGDRVAGYAFDWGLADQRSFYNFTVPASTTFATATGLPPDLAWYFEVRAVNGAGAGPPSPQVLVTLRAWGVVTGTITPANASALLDGAPIPVVNGTYSANTTIGVHLLLVAAPGYADASVSVTLPWNGTVFENVSLAVLPGAVAGFVAPANATVLWDGAVTPTSPSGFFSVNGVAVGTHVLAASAAGFVDVTENVSIAAGATRWVNLTLDPENGTVYLSISPRNASALVAGVAIPLSGAGTANVSLAPGRYPVSVVATGFEPFAGNVTVTAGAVAPVVVALTALPPAPIPSTPTSMVLPLPAPILGAIAIGAIVAVVAGALFVRRRRAAATPEPATSAEPPIWESDSTETDAATEGPPPEEGGTGP